MDDRFSYDHYLIRRKVLKLFGATFFVYGPDGEEGQLLFYTKMKAFKLKEDIRLYSDETMSEELLTITARNIWDISTTYDVIDAQSGESVGLLQRRGGRSIVRDTWTILDANEQEIGSIQEDNLFLALVRRFITGLVPQAFEGEVGGRPVLSFRQNFNLFIPRLRLDFSADTTGALDRRLGLAAGVLLSAIEGRQASS
jgi:hypothetical protein